MKKLLLLFIILFAFTISLAGCGNSAVSPSSDIEATPSADILPSPSKNTIPVILQAKIKMTDEQRNSKVAYITIDDGPSVNTPAYLQLLIEKNVTATFFIIGKNAEKYPQYVKDIAADGFAIGNHSYSHNYSLIYQSLTSFKDEIEHTNNIIKNILGQNYNVSIFRFPGGLKENDPTYVQVVYYLGMDYYAWSIDPEDAVGSKSSVSALVSKFQEQLGSQKHPVILMHDTANKDTSIAALGQMIDILKAKGYTFSVIAINK